MNETLHSMFPEVVSLDSKCTKACGYLRVKSVNFFVSIDCSATAQNLRVTGDCFLEKYLSCLTPDEQSQLLDSSNVVDSLSLLSRLLEEHLTSEQPSYCHTNLNCISNAGRLLQLKRLEADIANIGYQNVLSFASDLSSITFGYKSNEILMRFPGNFPVGAPVVEVNLPVNMPVNWRPNVSQVGDIFKLFCTTVDNCSEFWRVMNEIDSQLVVVDPNPISLKHVYRRVALEGSTSVIITFNPENMNAPPMCEFVGPAKSVMRYTEAFYSEKFSWDSDCTVIENMERLLDMKFPRKTTAGTSCDENLTSTIGGSVCGICYAPQLDGTPVEVFCENEPCAQCYHLSCFAEYVQANNPQSRGSAFKILIGECPYCTHQIAHRPTRTLMTS